MTGTTERGYARNALWGLSTWLIPLGLSFAGTPIIVGSLGTVDYGIYALVLGFVGYSFNLNTSRAVTKYVSEYLAEGRRAEIDRVVTATLALNLAVAATGLAVIAAAARPLVASVLEIEGAGGAKAVHGLWVAGAIVAATMISQSFAAVLQGYQRFDVYSKIFNATGIANLAGGILLALLGFGLVELLAWNLAVVAVFGAVTAVAVRRVHGGLGLSAGFEAGAVRRVLTFSAGVIGYQVLSNALLLFERGWLMRRFGEDAVTYYVVPMSLGIYLHAFVASLLIQLFPFASANAADSERLAAVYRRATKAVLAFVVFAAVALAVESRVFLGIWMGGDFADRSSLLLVIHAATFAIAGLLVVVWQMAEGLGRPAFNFASFGVCLAVAVVAMVVLSGPYGAEGAALGRLAGFAALALCIPVAERIFFGRLQTAFWLKAIPRVVLAGAGAALAMAAANRAAGTGAAGFLAAVAAGGAVYCLVLAGTGFVGAEDRELVRRLTGLAQREK